MPRDLRDMQAAFKCLSQHIPSSRNIIVIGIIANLQVAVSYRNNEEPPVLGGSTGPR